MDFADKLTTIAENEQKVFDAGKQAERDRFWDVYQNYGDTGGNSYCNAFSYGKFTDENYDPQHPIYTANGTQTAEAMFYRADKITDTKQPIYCRASRMLNTFGSATALVTIRTIHLLREDTTFGGTFTACPNLVNVTMSGTIGSDINFQWSPLSVESMKSVISCLKNFAGTDKDGTCTLTFSDDCWTKLEADSTAPDGGTWKDYVQLSLGWAI